MPPCAGLLSSRVYPVLFHLELGGSVVELRSFGVLVAAGCAAALWLALRLGRERGDDVDALRRLCLWALVAGLVGARLGYLLGAGHAAWGDCDAALGMGGWRWALVACARPLKLWEGGMAFGSGLLAGALVVWWQAARQGRSWRDTFDRLAPALALGHAVGRVGCFLGGCCWGRPAEVPWGVRFPVGSAVFRQEFARGRLPGSALVTPPLHPTQLYEAAGELALLGLLLWLLGRRRYEGEVALAWVAGYAAVRAVVEGYRGDPGHGPGSLGRLVAVVLAVAATVAWAALRRRTLRPGPAAAPRLPAATPPRP